MLRIKEVPQKYSGQNYHAKSLEWSMRFADYNGIKFVEIRLVELKIWILRNYTEAVRILVVSEKFCEKVSRMEDLSTRKLWRIPLWAYRQKNPSEKVCRIYFIDNVAEQRGTAKIKWAKLPHKMSTMIYGICWFQRYRVCRNPTDRT
jgi:hypothetical protein